MKATGVSLHRSRCLGGIPPRIAVWDRAQQSAHDHGRHGDLCERLHDRYPLRSRGPLHLHHSRPRSRYADAGCAFLAALAFV